MLEDVSKALAPTEGVERQRAVALDMRRELMRLVAEKETTRADAPMRNSAGAYTDPLRFAAELGEIFGKMPLLAGFTRDVQSPGDKFLFEAAGRSILIVRGKDLVVRAFLNMCPHRAAEVVGVCDGAKLMTCPFHGWTFDLEGKLVGLPRKQGFEGIDRAELGLIKVPVIEWHGMIFVIAQAGDAPIDIEAHLGDFAPELAQIDFATAKEIRTSRLDVDANWKMALDTFGESYHLSVLHPETVGKAAITDVLLYEDFSPHHRIGFPLLTMQNDAKRREAEWPERPYSGIHLIFPNTLIHVTTLGPGNTYFVYRIFPSDEVGKSFTLMTTYRAGDVADDVDTAPWHQMHDYQAMVVGTEDYSVVRGAQRNLARAPEGFSVVYGNNEIALQRFHQAVAARIGAAMA
ncbi:MAG: Phenylpropionate dioxygenase, large terminal subunit [Bradyrhizobium sp.]|nr:Phenylpropionate dioxygenase, large terminal subunit [Bradyrhizobium sp.]